MSTNSNKLLSIKDLLAEDRLEKVGNLYIQTNKEYRGLTKKSIRLASEIKNALPGDKEHLIEEYSQNCMTMSALTEDLFYRQGVDDGLRIKQLVEEVGL